MVCHVGELNQVILNIVVNSAHAIESEPTLLGLSAHLLCVARKPAP